MTASFYLFSHDGHSFDFDHLSFETLSLSLKKVLPFYRGRVVGSSP